MPRPAKPWWDATRKQWACRHNGRYTPLGDGTFEQATREFHRLKSIAPPRPADGAHQTVADVLESYLRFVRANKSPATLAAYSNAIKSFDAHLGDCDLRDFVPAQLQLWLDDQPKKIAVRDRDGKPKLDAAGTPICRLVTWSETTRRGNAMTIQQAFRWARRMRLIDDDPLSDFVKPPKRRREGVLTDNQWSALMDRYAAEDPFRDLLQFCRMTGCRPQEVVRIEARHISDNGLSVRFEARHSKGKRRPRVIVLPQSAADIVARLSKMNCAGPIFRNSDGTPWNRDAIRNRLKRANRKLGLPRLNLGMIRKTWETDALTRVPLAIVAELAGHDPATALEHYSHLATMTDALRSAAETAAQATSPRNSDNTCPPRRRRERGRTG